MADEKDVSHSLVAHWLDEIRPSAYSIPADLVGGKVGEWVDVVRLDHLRDAVCGTVSPLYPPGRRSS